MFSWFGRVSFVPFSKVQDFAVHLLELLIRELSLMLFQVQHEALDRVLSHPVFDLLRRPPDPWPPPLSGSSG